MEVSQRSTDTVVHMSIALRRPTVVVPLQGDLVTSGLESRYSRTRLVAEQYYSIEGNALDKCPAPTEGDYPYTVYCILYSYC